MITPKIKDEITLTAIKGMRNEYAFEKFVEMLQRDLSHYRKMNDTADGNDLCRQQGVCIYLNSLLEQIEKAPKTLDAVRKDAERHRAMNAGFMNGGI